MASALFGSLGVNRFLVNQPNVSRHPAVKRTRRLSGLASNSTKTAWITISAAMTEQTTRTIVARREKTRAEPVPAMGDMMSQAALLGDPSGQVRRVRSGR